MSVELHPGIGSLDPGSLCYSLYTQLYQNFFNAQDQAAVTEGDPTSVRLRNTAYGFAEAIAGAVEGGSSGGGGGGVLSDYLKLSGGNMTGPLTANYGFEAGIGNRRIVEMTAAEDSDDGISYGVRISGALRLDGDALLLGGRNVLRYDPTAACVVLNAPTVNFGAAVLRSLGELRFGDDEQAGVLISTSGIRISGHDVYHGGNANLSTVDWTMHDATVTGDLSVAGTVSLTGLFRALYGAELGAGGKVLLTVTPSGTSLLGDLIFGDSHGIRMNGVAVLQRLGEKDLLLGGAGGDLLLGGGHTNKVRLQTNLTDIDGDNVLISSYGGAYFPDSLRVRHNYGKELLSTFRKDADEGIVLYEQLRFSGEDSAYLCGVFDQLGFVSKSDHTSEQGGGYREVATVFGHIPSVSLRRAQNTSSDTFIVLSYADFILLGVPTEVVGSVGISESLTRLSDGCLFFTDEIRLQQTTDGVRHYGNASFSGSLSSTRFTSGLAGSGWSILVNATTGNASATFDELTIRKRMRVYEMVVQRTRSTNGALWISDTCSGESVQKL